MQIYARIGPVQTKMCLRIFFDPVEIFFGAAAHGQDQEFRRVVGVPGKHQFFERPQIPLPRFHDQQDFRRGFDFPQPTIMGLDFWQQIGAGDEARRQRGPGHSPGGFYIGGGDQDDGNIRGAFHAFLKRVYFTPDFWLSQGMETELPSLTPGTLYVVATPIGNLEDITLRALRILREVDRIACEDTRQTRKLLDRHGIEKALVSYHEHNERERAGELLAELAAGKSIAIVSDAGTPLIADPGYRLVAEARARGITVTPIPGPSAVLAALSASGLPTDAFRFGGFLPAKKTQRKKALDEARDHPGTLVFYEAPHRILEALEDIAEAFGACQVTLARELTKIHEEFLTGEPLQLREQLAARPAIKGEFTLMISPATGLTQDQTPLEEAFDKLIQSGTPRMEAMKIVARERGLSKREVYQKLNAR